MRWRREESCPKPAPLISHGSAVPAFSVERLRRLLHSPGNAPLAHSCFGLTPQGEAFGNPYKPQFAIHIKTYLYTAFEVLSIPFVVVGGGS